MKTLAGRTAVVTGAASGIGEAIALELARQGANLALVDIYTQRLAEVAAAAENLGVAASTHQVDVADREQMAALPDAVVAAHGGVHILVNNAGVSVNLPFDQQGIDDLEWITGINYWGVMYGCKFFLPHLQAAEEGHIVNLSSSAGLTGMKGQSSYAATKFAVRGLSECLFIELAGSNVGITCVHLGAVATNILQAARMDQGEKDKMLRYFHLAMPPAKAARLVVKAIRKNRFKLVFCVESRLLDFLKRVMPVTTLRLLSLGNRGSPGTG